MFSTQVDPAVVREASERRVAPGTPINMLKKRIKRAKAASSTSVNQAKVEPNNSRRANDKGAAAKGQGGGAVTVHAHPGLGRAARMKQGPARPALSLSLDAAKMKQVSDYLKSQIGEAHMLLEVCSYLICAATCAPVSCVEATEYDQERVSPNHPREPLSQYLPFSLPQSTVTNKSHQQPTAVSRLSIRCARTHRWLVDMLAS